MGKTGDMVFTDYHIPHLTGHNVQNNPTANQQAMTERMYTRVLTELCANRFEWEGLPKSVDKRFLELNLFWRALTVVYKDPDVGELLAVQGSGSGAMNMVDNPLEFTVIGPGLKARTLRTTATRGPDEEQLPAECVPIWANMMRVPDLDIVRLYAAKLADIDRTIEINVKGMRHNKIFMADENSRLSIDNISRQAEEGVAVIKVSNTLDMSGFQVLDFGISEHSVTNLQVARSKMWNDCMGLLGINNANQEKKERLVAAEVGANDEQVEAARNIALNCRQWAAEQINELFGTSISVDFKGEAARKKAEAEAAKETAKPKAGEGK